MFFGTPQWAVPSLDALLASDVEVAACVTNPDRPAGRGLSARASAVKVRAVEAGLEVLQPPSARDLLAPLRAIAPDACIVVAYGKIFPPAVLEVPRIGFLNLHFSLLPAYRGAAPVQRALLDGATTTGVSVILLTEGMDEGPVLATAPAPVADEDTAGTLGDRLAHLGAPLLVRTLKAYAAGELEPRPQDHDRATYAPVVTADDARIDWSRPAVAVRNLVRACNPEPGAWTTLRGERLKVFGVERAARPGHLAPGELEAAADLLVGCGDGELVLTAVQLSGRRRMSGADAARGLRLGPGEALR